MTEEKKRPVGRPEKEVKPEELIPLIEEYISKLENIERKGQSFRYKSSELDTEHNRKIADEYYKKFSEYLKYKHLGGGYNQSRNKPRTLLTITSKSAGFNDVQMMHNKEYYRYLIFPGVIEI